MEASPSDENGEGRGWRNDAAFMLVFGSFTLAIVGVDVLTVVHDRAVAGNPVSPWEPLVWEFSSGLVLLALLPVAMAFYRRHPLRPPPDFGWLAWHLPAGLVFSLVHVVAMGLLRWAIYAAAGFFYHPLKPLSDWPYELRKDLLVYAGILGGYAVWRLISAAPPPPMRDASETIEVRDGPRRHFVPVNDILWVEAAGNYVELHRAAAPVLHRAPLSQMERRLAQAGFVRIHRSRLVRRDAIAAVETRPSGDFVVRLVTGQTLLGSRRFRTATRLDRGAAAD